MLTSDTAYLHFPLYLEKQPGEQGMRLLCPGAASQGSDAILLCLTLILVRDPKRVT